MFPAWTYNGTVPGPVIRATEDDLLRVHFANGGSHPHTIHFHGIHPANMDGVFEIVSPGETFTYEFPARPYGMHLYHCHATPLKKHIHKGLYGAFIIDPPEPRPPAQEIVMVMNAFDTDGDGENNFYAVNGPAFYYARYPITRPALADRPYLHRQPHRVRPHQLVPPPRRLLPLLPDRARASTSSTRTRSCSARASAGSSRSTSPTPATSCSTPTSPSSPSSAGWASSRSVELGGGPLGRRERTGPSGADAAAALGARPDPAPRRRRLALLGTRRVAPGPRRPQPAASRRVRRPPRRVLPRRDPHPGDEPAARRPHHRHGHRRRRDRPLRRSTAPRPSGACAPPRS